MTETNGEETTYKATIYHRKFKNEQGGRHKMGANLGLGYEFALENGANPEDPEIIEDSYVEAGTIEVSVSPADTPPEVAYRAWERGQGRDTDSVRSMAVGDVIVIHDAGDNFGFFVDNIGLAEIDVSHFDKYF